MKILDSWKLGPGPFDAACGVAQDRLLRGRKGDL
jgi:hypothetical protein